MKRSSANLLLIASTNVYSRLIKNSSFAGILRSPYSRIPVTCGAVGWRFGVGVGSGSGNGSGSVVSGTGGVSSSTSGSANISYSITDKSISGFSSSLLSISVVSAVFYKFSNNESIVARSTIASGPA